MWILPVQNNGERKLRSLWKLFALMRVLWNLLEFDKREMSVNEGRLGRAGLSKGVGSCELPCCQAAT